MKCRTPARWLLPTLLLAMTPPGIAIADSQEGGAGAPDEQTLYFLGTAIGRQLGAFDLNDEELATVVRGLRDQAMGKAEPLDGQKYGPMLQQLQRERQERAAEKERASSIAFLKEAASVEGATETDSGLIIVTLTEGTGESPQPSDTVKVHYHGTLRDGTVFDSSLERGTPAEFPLSRVIPCWTEGVGLMKVGGKAKLVCPPDIAYGDRGMPPTIPGGAALTFEVELIEIK